MGFLVIMDAVIGVLKPLEVEAIFLYLTTLSPWVNIPVVKTILKQVIGNVVDFQMRTGRSVAYNAYIDKYKSDASNEAKKAVDQYNEAVSDEQRKIAKQKIIDEVRKLGKFTNPS